MYRAWMLMVLLFAGTTLAQSEPPTPEQVPALIAEARDAYQADDYARMESALARAVALRPYLANLRFMLAKAYALQDKKREAYNSLVILQSQGLSFPLDGDPDFENLRGYQLYDYIRDEFAKNAQPYGESEPLFRIDSTSLLIEAMAYDPTADRYLVGSITNGTIDSVAADGSRSAFIKPDFQNRLLGVAALAVDADRNTLWVASGASPHVQHAVPADAGRTFIHRFDLETGNHIALYPAPTRPSYFIDIALSPDGRLFVADSAVPRIWQLDPGADEPELEPFFGSAGLTGIRTLTVDDAGEHLYFADYELGVIGIRIGEDQAFHVHLGEHLNLSGIDLMRWYEDSLVLVQNGFVPKRVLRFQLFKDRRTGRHAQAVVSGQPTFRNPTTGTLVDSDLVLIANSHRNAYDPATGEPRSDADLEPHRVIAIPLDFGWLPPPEGSLKRLQDKGSE